METIGDLKDADWCELHDWAKFTKAVAAFRAKQDGKDKKPLLPSSQSHAVREMLFSQDPDAQESEWKLLGKRYEGFLKKWKSAVGDDFLYQKGRTLFLDAL
ncbi:MAG TPA: hypothetical protein P5069_18045, partial [Candidatus Hydrogenedentes bacterium]|nr:hypothetical protein [Candidatus Hydrogenedentota bacterium]